MGGDINLWLLSYFPWLSNFIPLLSFLAPIIGGGEFGIIAVAFLFVDSSVRFFVVAFFSALSMISIDSIWFFIGRSKLFLRFREWKKISAQYRNLERNIERLSNGRDLIIISLAKILVGTRILLILYLSGRSISFRKYLEYNVLVNFLWAILLVFIGVMASKGFNSIIAIFRNVQAAITFLIVFFVVIYIFQRWLSQRLMKKQEVFI